MEHVRRAVLLLLGVAAGVNLAWRLFAPAVPILVSLAVVIVILYIAVFGRRAK
jgi:hypothetical protein